MNISLQNIDKVSAKLTVKLEKADYQEKVEKSLKTIRQKANIPGFRPGMVPMGLVKKQYGTSVKAEEVNRLLQEKVYEYLKENQVNMLGEPLPAEEQSVIDFATQEDFEVIFDIALAPEFELDLNNQDKVDYYTIDVNEEIVNRQIGMYTQRAGKYEKVESHQDGDMLKGLLAELDEAGNTKEGGLQVEGAIIMPSYINNEEQKNILSNAKVNEVLVINPSLAYEGRETELASLLKITKEEVSNYTGNFSYQIEEITRFVAAELNQEIFDQVYGEGKINSEDEFKAKVKEDLQAQFTPDSDYKFLIDIRKYITDKIGKLEYPDTLLKRIMIANNKEKGENFVDENYEKSIEELTWHLIKEKLIKQYDIKIDNEDVMNMAKGATKAQFAQYGMLNIPEDVVENYAKEMVKKKENVDGLVNRAIETKLSAALKGVITLNEKTISLDDFNKMFE